MTEKYTFDNGMSAVLTPMPYIKSVSIGIFIKSGSVYESKSNNGIAHFIEHMLFKGTKTRTAESISNESDELGGALNAYTAEECTCVYIRSLAEDQKRALDLVLDVVFEPEFNKNDIENEKNVILEEIYGTEDDPEDAAQEMLMANMFKGNSIGMPVLGSAENVLSFTREDIESFYKARFVPQNILISVAGNFDRSAVLDAINRKISAMHLGDASEDDRRVPEIHGGVYTGKRETGQLQLAVGYPAVTRFDDRIHAFILLSSILGGDDSSRLFRRLRNENGLVYSVDASVMEYDNMGVFTVSTGFSPENTDKVIQIIRCEIDDIVKNGVSKAELNRAKRAYITRLQLDDEGTMATAMIEGKREFYKIKADREEIMQKYNAVTVDDIKSAAMLAFGDGRLEAVAVVGDVDDDMKFSIIGK